MIRMITNDEDVEKKKERKAKAIISEATTWRKKKIKGEIEARNEVFTKLVNTGSAWKKERKLVGLAADMKREMLFASDLQ